VVKVHSHPEGHTTFSSLDDAADRALGASLCNWVEQDIPHASVVMLPNGRMFGRCLTGKEELVPLAKISVLGASIEVWEEKRCLQPPDFATSHTLAFGDNLHHLLSCLRVGVVGCSGTGSPTIEQLARLGVGEIVIVDDDLVEYRNLNRIIHATRADAMAGRAKVEVLAETLMRSGLPVKVTPVKQNLLSEEAIRSLAGCDVVFGCMDTHEGRFVLNLLATHYLIPYFDLGVRINVKVCTDGMPRITEATGSVHYLQPGLSSLLSRRVINLEAVRTEGLQRTDPEAHIREAKKGYLHGIEARQPAVISVNMQISSLAVNDFLARMCPYRQTANEDIACIRISLSSLDLFTESEDGQACSVVAPGIGRGDVEPWLGLSMLSRRSSA